MTRRGFCRIMPALAAGSPLARSQVTSPAGNISVAGSVATFWADYVRPLQSVAHTFVERYRWLVTFEEAPLIYPGDYVDVTLNPAAGGRALAPRGGYLQFSFDVGPEGEPADPGLVLRTALEAYHRAGFPGRYELRAEEGYFHIVPTARADVTGVLRAVRSPLDATVTLEGGGRNP
ncbi:MAG TPA: hypothetical protein VNJ11_06410, partial [Bryobacteraceae bacterium]|nr:hypothetical protein [Bryobacteraceae bacterium]